MPHTLRAFLDGYEQLVRRAERVNYLTGRRCARNALILETVLLRDLATDAVPRVFYAHGLMRIALANGVSGEKFPPHLLNDVDVSLPDLRGHFDKLLVRKMFLAVHHHDPIWTCDLANHSHRTCNAWTELASTAAVRETRLRNGQHDTGPIGVWEQRGGGGRNEATVRGAALHAAVSHDTTAVCPQAVSRARARWPNARRVGGVL